MIYLRLSGGLGNQLFQFGYALFIQEITGKKISIDISNLSKYETPRDFSLSTILNINFDTTIITKTPHLFNKMRMSKVFSGRCFRNKFISDKNAEDIIDDDFVNISSIFVDGYFIQSINNDIFDRIVSCILTLLKRDLYQPDKYRGCCSLHIRGGDFLKLGWNVCDSNYYNENYNKLTENHRIEKVISLTDDNEYFLKINKELNFENENISNSMANDFSILLSTKYSIISSSTFSFWARALNSKLECSYTVIPVYWMKDSIRNINISSEV